MSLLLSFLGNHILPSIVDSAIMLLLVLLAFKLLKIKNPATRFTFLLIPLVKPFIILLDSSIKVKEQQVNFYSPVQVGLRFPDPLDLFRPPFRENFAALYNHSAVVWLFEFAIMTVLAIIIARWVQLFLFLNMFKKEEPLDTANYPEIYSVLDKLVEKFDVRKPKLVLSDRYELVPFSISSGKPIVVLSKDLIDEFSIEQLEIMLAHELAHLKRRDTAYSWLIVILRDLMFFNPLIHKTYRILEAEREKDCDLMVLEKTSINPKNIAGVLLDLALFYSKAKLENLKTYQVMQKGFLYQKSTLEERMESILKPVRKRKSTRFKLFLKGIAFLLLVYIQFGVIFIIQSRVILIR